MRIGGKGRLKAAEDYFIPKTEAEEIIKSVREALKDWKKVAKRLGAQERDIKPIFTLSLVHENSRPVNCLHGRPSGMVTEEQIPAIPQKREGQIRPVGYGSLQPNENSRYSAFMLWDLIAKPTKVSPSFGK